MDAVRSNISDHIPALRRYAQALTRNTVEADDLLQESLVRALSKRHLFQPGTNLRAWLFTILHNQNISTLRREGRRGHKVDPDDAAGVIAIRSSQEHSLILQSAARALDKLPDQQRVLIELAAVRGFSYEDIASRFGLAVGTVKSRIARGRQRLHQMMNSTAYSPEAVGHA